MRVLGAAFLITVMTTYLALPHGVRGDGRPSPSSQEGAGQTLRAPATRFAVFDSECLAQRGINPKANDTLAALRAFGDALNVKLFDPGALAGAVFIADGSVDISDYFIKALKSKPSGPKGLAAPAVNVPAATVALIDTEAFGRERAGVTSLVKAFGRVTQEFAPRKAEIQKLREESEAASGERREKLEAEVKKRQEAAQAALDKRVKELTGPVYEEIGRALMSFCKKNGLTFVFDLSKLEKDDTLPPFDLPLPADAPDVTEAFISAYNRGELKP
ncbi:MAG: OmpH family outer membrane protein [Acidobacteria bacterium]|nr:OmpH family outer membrane protein [Acidobacteriota bacterium]